MTSSRTLARALPVAACVALLAMPGSASAQRGGRSNDLPVVSDSRLAEDLILGRSAALGVIEQPSGENYLPPTRSNVDLVSRLQLHHPYGDVTADEIADVGVLKNTAYLAGWSQGKFTEPCDRGGVYSVDISNPAEPKQLAFRPALAQNYHGEGVHAISVKTPAFSGDLLAVNNETCTETTTRRMRTSRKAAASTSTTCRTPPTRGSSRGPTATTAPRARWSARTGSQMNRTRSSSGRTATRPTRSSSTTKRSTTSTSSTSPTRQRPARRRVRPRRGVPPDRAGRSRPGQLPGQLLPRHDRQEDRRHPDDADELLGRRLRDARRRRSRQSDLHRRHRLRRERPAHRLLAAGGQRSPGRVQRTTTATSWPRTRTSACFASRPRSRAGPTPASRSRRRAEPTPAVC